MESFTETELNHIHMSLITRERVIRQQWFPYENDIGRKKALLQEANTLRTLSNKVCAARLTKEIGLHIEPLT